MTSTGHVIDGGGTSSGRWLRGRRLKITLWIAAVEGLLALLHVIHWWEVVVLAAIALGFWWFVGRGNRSDLLRQTSWIFAASQLLVVLVPAALAIVGTLAVVFVALFAVAALIFLFRERR
jgi:cation transport ATPase